MMKVKDLRKLLEEASEDADIVLITKRDEKWNDLKRAELTSCETDTVWLYGYDSGDG